MLPFQPLVIHTLREVCILGDPTSIPSSGLWSNCLQMKDNLETFVCQISDLDGKPASGDADCKGDLLVSRVCLGADLS